MHSASAAPAFDNDPALAAWLAAADAPTADAALHALLREHQPVLARVLRRRAGGTRLLSRSDLDDLLAEATARLVARLLELRSGTNPSPIAAVPAYAATIAANTWHQWLRTRFPERTRLKNRLRYFCSHAASLSLWEAGDELWCGPSSARTLTVPTRCARVAHALANPDSLQRDLAPTMASTGTQEQHVARAVLEWAGAPVALDDLVDLVADLLGIHDATPVSRSADDDDEWPDAVDEAVDPSPSALSTLSDREHLSRLWTEISGLPVHQRHALLLNLRDAEGRDVIALLPVLGIASIRAIADTLEMPALTLAGLWRDLPLDDARIAERLGVTRQQVINLRKSARARLARRIEPRGTA